jgi:hypothetical protein
LTGGNQGEPFEVWAPEDTVLPLLYIKDAIKSLIMLHDAEIGLATIPRIIKGDAAEKEWGWKVTYSLSETIKDFIDEYKKNPSEV